MIHTVILNLLLFLICLSFTKNLLRARKEFACDANGLVTQAYVLYISNVAVIVLFIMALFKIVINV